MRSKSCTHHAILAWTATTYGGVLAGTEYLCYGLLCAVSHNNADIATAKDHHRREGCENPREALHKWDYSPHSPGEDNGPARRYWIHDGDSLFLSFLSLSYTELNVIVKFWYLPGIWSQLCLNSNLSNWLPSVTVLSGSQQLSLCFHSLWISLSIMWFKSKYHQVKQYWGQSFLWAEWCGVTGDLMPPFLVEKVSSGIWSVPL